MSQSYQNPYQSSLNRRFFSQYSWDINDKLGQGFTSLVYRGRHDKSGQIVAVKVINLQQIKCGAVSELIDSEISILTSLNHPNVLHCNEIFSSDKECLIVSEYCEGGDLQKQVDLIGKGIQMDWKQVVNFLIQTAEAIQYLHQSGILHRDIKPANLFLKKGKVKLGDFGFAKRQKDLENCPEKFRIGTPLYMSPKNLTQNICNKQNDVWAFGVTMYQILQGKAPWCAKSEKELKLMFGKAPIFLLKNSKRLHHIVEGCLCYDERNRWKIQRVVQELRKVRSSNEACSFEVQIYSLSRRMEAGVIENANKQNVTRNQNNQVSNDLRQSTLKKVMKANYEILRWMINYSRFVFKLLERVEKHFLFQASHPKHIVEFIAKILHLLITKLHGLLSYSLHLPLANFEAFKKTNYYERVRGVSQQYYQKYMIKLMKYQLSYRIPSQSNSIQVPKDLLHDLNVLKILKGNYQHNLTLDHLLTLLIVNDQIDQRGVCEIKRVISFDLILQMEGELGDSFEVDLQIRLKEVLERLNEGINL